MIHNGDCLEVLKTMKDASVDSLVTDPPAGISFMGKSWDSDKGGRKQWISWMTDVMTECHRVLKPGAHGLIWALPRTSHWTATALEDAGFEIRDVVTHLFGSGFPKSMNISIAIDKASGAMGHRGKAFPTAGRGERADIQSGSGWTVPNEHAGVTDEAKQWQGWGTALKPASEHWILVRKPCSEKTVAANVLKHGCGGLNIDAGRVGFQSEADKASAKPQGVATSKQAKDGLAKASGVDSERVTFEVTQNAQGRFPANLVLSHTEHCTESQCDIECAVSMLDEQSGFSKTPSVVTRGENNHMGPTGSKNKGAMNNVPCFGDSGGASRFFYCAKISTRERNAGLEDLEKKEKKTLNNYVRPSEGRTASKSGGPQQNHHPTVKPQKLMRYLIKMITPPGGVVLDPFMGSGSTGCAAVSEGFEFIGIEREPEYAAIAEKRIESMSRAIT